MNRNHVTNLVDRYRDRGFTLIEVMIVVAIVGILAAIAFPSYIQYITKSNRSAAETVMFAQANKEEQYFLDARTYTSTILATVPSGVSSTYTITAAFDMSALPPSYTITATPIGAQLTRDTKCGTLTLSQATVKGQSGTGSTSDCW